MRGNVVAYDAIQLIQFSGKNLMTSIPDLVKCQEA